MVTVQSPDFGVKSVLYILIPYFRLEKATEALEFFSTRQWTWDSTNIEELEKSMEPADRAIFGIVIIFTATLSSSD